MWIILEGVDGSGKSTLQSAVTAKIRGHVKEGHLGPPASADTALDECLTGGLPDTEHDRVYRPGGGWHLVSDRLHMGCPVYGPLYRPHLDLDGYGDFGVAGWRYIELYLASRGAITFLVQVSAETAIRRVVERNDENFFSVDSIVESLPHLIDKYEWLAPDTMTLGPRIFEPTLDEIDGLADRMINIAEGQEEDAIPLAEFDDYIGSPRPKTLIVCEPMRQTRLDALRLMREDTWQSVGFCSSAHDADALERLVTTLHWPNVVGLGDLPGSASSFVWNANGTYVDDVVAASTAVAASLR